MFVSHTGCIQTNGVAHTREGSIKKLKLRWHTDSQVELLRNGEQFFPALCLAIAGAQRNVHLETYIFNLDRTGNQVLDVLAQACARGIKVRVVIDGFGSYQHAAEIAQRLGDMGAQCRVYRPEPTGLRRYRFDPRRLRRLHRKVAVVDGQVAFVGGINIVDDLVDVPNDGEGPRPRFDFAVQLRGSIVPDVITIQRKLWLRMAWRRRDDWAAFYRRFSEWGKRIKARQNDARTPAPPGIRAALLLRDNVRFRRKIENVYVRTIMQAKRDILIANAYFFPGRRVRQALEQAAARGVRVRLLLQGRSEYPMQYRASRYMYCKLLDDGIEIHEYMASYLHAKVAVIDDYAMVGSANLDPFSLLLAREANVFVDNAEFAAQLKVSLELEMKNDGSRVTEEQLQTRGFWGEMIDGVAYLMLRAGVALTGQSSQY